MAVKATAAVWARSRSKGTARLVLLALADAVNQRRIESGEPWEAWPSQATLAKKANCSDRAVRRALHQLKHLGEIEDSGRVKGRGCRVYILTPPEPRTDASNAGRDSPDGRTFVSTTMDECVRLPRTPASTEPEVKPEVKPEVESEDEQELAPTVAERSSSDSQTPEELFPLTAAQAPQRHDRQQVESELAALKTQLPSRTGPFIDQTTRAIATLERQLASDALADSDGQVSP